MEPLKFTQQEAQGFGISARRMAIAFRIALRKAALLLCQQGLGKLEDLEQWLLEQAYCALEEAENQQGVGIVNRSFSLVTTADFMEIISKIPEDLLETIFDLNEEEAEKTSEEVVQQEEPKEEGS